MGSKWEVWAYRQNMQYGWYDWVMVWSGEPWWYMLHKAREAKKTCGCVKVMWR